MPATKPIFDALQFAGKPDSLGLPVLYVAPDGVFNRATNPARANNSPPEDPEGELWQRIAQRRLARAALGIEPDIQQHKQFSPSVASTIALNIESEKVMDAIYLAAEPSVRRPTVAWLTGLIATMREEAAQYGKTLTIGSFLYPPSPIWKADARDARRPAWEAAAALDLQPLVQAVDCFFLDCYTHSDDFEKWRQGVIVEIARAKALDPSKPVYLFVTPVYSHNASERQKWRPLPTDLWRKVLTAALELGDGTVLWNITDPNDPTGVRMWRWNPNAEWYQVLKEVAAGANPVEVKPD